MLKANLPRERGVAVVVVDEDVVESLGPVDGVDDLRVAVEDVGGDVDGALVGVDRDPGKVLVRLHVQTVVADLDRDSQDSRVGSLCSDTHTI